MSHNITNMNKIVKIAAKFFLSYSGVPAGKGSPGNFGACPGREIPAPPEKNTGTAEKRTVGDRGEPEFCISGKSKCRYPVSAVYFS